MAKGTTKKSTRRARAAQKAERPTKSAPKHAVKADEIALPVVKRRRWQRVPRAERPVRRKLSNVFRLTRKTWDLLTLDVQLIVGIVLVYGLLNILLVRGLNGSLNVSELTSEFDKVFQGGWGHLAAGFSVFALLISSSSSNSASNDAAGAYQTFLVLIVSLALVWAFRQLLTTPRPKLRVRDGFYQGMYPLVPVILVSLVIALQLIPMLIGGLLYSTVISNGIAITVPEILFWLAIFVTTTIISFRMVSSSVFALYIASLPGMTPLRALRSARDLVRFRRLVVVRKQLFLPLLLVVVLAVVLVPIIMTVPVLAQWAFFLLSMFILPTIHAYLYTLYRELLNE